MTVQPLHSVATETQPKKRIGIFVIAYNAVNKLDWTLDRVPDEVWQKVEEVFLFDDCSTDNTYYAAVGYKNVKGIEKLTVHRNPKNLRYGGNQKAGYQYAIARGFDVVVMLHADGQYAPEVLPQLLEPLEKDEADMVFGSRMASGGDPLKGGMPFYKFIGNKILTFLENRITGMKLTEFHSGYRIYSCESLKRLPFMLNSNDWHFDTDILLQFHESRMRIKELPIPTYYGDEICYVNGLPYAFNCVKSAVKYRLHKARLHYSPNYDLKASHHIYRKSDPHSSQAQILRWVEQERPERVLEVGTATGLLTAEMNALGVSVVGIEQDEEMAEVARQYCESLIVGDIDKLDLSDQLPFDAIILGEILEHVRNPKTILTKLKTLLRPGGKVLLSLPNVPSIWVRLISLFGRLNHNRVGILDESHLRFFTLASSKKLAMESGLDILRINATPIPVTSSTNGKGHSLSFLHTLNWVLTKVAKTLFGYHFILVCQPKEFDNS
jgi:glycosyltransferase involved in cell wall biosynthesis/precorrin-6B methylase 2